jgi:ABC-type transport system involved in cytochrome bd biosynthesis fused ATPase/permease subunit
MNILELINFFRNEIEKKVWFQVFIKFILHLSLVFSEIFFLSSFFLILNKKIDSDTFNYFNQKLEIYFNNLFGGMGSVEINIIIMVFFLFTKNILTILHLSYFNGFIFKLSVKKSSSLLRSFLNKSFQDFNKTNISTYIKQLIRDVENVFVHSFALLINFISELIYVIVIIFFLRSLIDFDPNYEIVILFLVLIIVLYYLFIAAKKFGRLRATSEITVFKTLTDTLSIFKEIKLINNSKDFVYRFENYLNKWFKTRISAEVINMSPKIMFEVSILIFFLLVFKNENPQLSINEFIIKYSVFAIALLRLIPNIAKLSSLISTFLYNVKSIEMIKNDLKKKYTTNQNKILKKGQLNSIELRRINLNYINKSKKKTFSKFKNLNYSFKKGNIYGLYGKSGSGKTSLLNLISGFIRPNSGKIFFNNKEYKFYDLTRKFEIGYSPQETTIIDENITINTTLKYENNDIIKKKLKEFLQSFNLKKFNNPKYFKDGLESSIKNMSGGEKQRIGFIRAMLRDPDLVLLDEPTSSLDQKNEKKIFNFLLKIKKEKIIVVTSHKENQKKYFDKIINL